MADGRSRIVEGGILLEFDSVVSTMDVAKDCVCSGRAEVIGVRADFQTGGRGQRGQAWSAPAGTCLLVTYVFAGETKDVRRFALAAPLAVADAIQTLAGITSSVKWPNDVLVEMRKVAGVLIEARSSQPNSLHATLVGIGINVNVGSFAPDLAGRATSLLIETGRKHSIASLESEVRTNLRDWLARDWSEILAAWRSRDVSFGLRYAATAGSDHVVGAALGITDSGSLLVRLDDGTVLETVSGTSV
jgi:BirA family biotin operon repressor/biotin-[acetyl-CoA-carboxylase] ligase